MKRNTITFFVLMMIVTLMGACGNNAWDELPEPIVKFVSEYFPFGEVSSYKETTNSYVVKIRNGATLTFDKQYDWTDVNGNGTTLPSQFLYDKLPSVLYEYIQSMEETDDVYRATRSGDQIVLKLLDGEIDYDGATETISEPAASRSVLPF